MKKVLLAIQYGYKNAFFECRDNTYIERRSKFKPYLTFIYIGIFEKIVDYEYVTTEC